MIEAINHLNIIYREILKFYITNNEKVNWADIGLVNDTTYLATTLGKTRRIVQNSKKKLSKDSEK